MERKWIMKIRCENYSSDDIKRVYICLANTNEVLRLDIVNPVDGSPVLKGFNKSNTTKIDFEDGLELDNFIEALIQLQHYHRVNTGVWRGMK